MDYELTKTRRYVKDTDTILMMNEVGTREKVLERINVILAEQGRKITDFVAFVSGVIDAYDDVYFNGQIKEMALKYNISNFPDVHLTNVEDDSEKPKGKDVAGYIQNESVAHKRSSYGVCDIIVIYDLSGEPKSVKIEFYNTFFANYQVKNLYTETVKKLYSSYGIVGKQYTLYTIMYIVEHVVIHLLMILWKYHEKGVITPHINVNYKTRGIYSTHGMLYKCLLKEYFGLGEGEGMYVAFIKYYRLGKSDENYSNAVKMAKQGHPGIVSLNTDKLGLIKWANNSCFFDSLIMGMLLGSSSFLRDSIIKRVTTPGDYLNKKGRFKNPFPGKKATITADSTCQLSATFRDYFKTTLDKILDGNIFIACSIRSILGSLDNNINSGEQYEPFMVYGVLSNLYPHIKLSRVPTIRKRNGKWKRKENVTHENRIVAFPMDDYVTLDINSPRKGVIPLFEEITKEDHLCFFIHHPPWLKRLNELGDEFITSTSYDKLGQSTEETTKVTKVRKFEEYIMKGKYRLYAVILHSGNTPKNLSEASFGHYTLLVRPFFDRDGWYYYDDLTPSFGKVASGSVPNNAFLDTGRRRPHMLLYEKL